MTDLDESVLAIMVRHAAAIAVQDAVTHMRHVNMIAGVAMGLAQQMMIVGGATDGGRETKIAQTATDAALVAQRMVDAATANFIAVCNAAARLGGTSPPAGLG